MKLKEIPIGQLKISRSNMRHGGKAPDVSDILPSIRENGVQQSMLVRKEGKSYGVVAGRRRLFALRIVAKETGKTLKAPCGILEDGDNSAAIEASIIENIARLPATEMEQYEAFGRLKKSGRSVEDIAAYFGVTEIKVKRILALSELTPEIRDLYANEKICVSTIRALTLATPEQQAAWLVLFNGEDKYEPQGDELKAWLTGGYNISTKTALFELADYAGTIITDLFDEDSYFRDPDTFWEYQNKAIATAVKELRGQGWGEVIVMDRGESFHAWQYSKRPQDAGGKVFVEISHDGKVEAHLGYLTNADAKKIDAILSGDKDNGSKTKTSRPEMSGPLNSYIGLHRHAVARAALLDNPNVALRLTVAHMLAGSNLWQVNTHHTGAIKDATRASIENSVSYNRFIKERESVRKLLGILWEDAKLTDASSSYSCAAMFIKLLGFTDNEILRVMTCVMAESLSSRSVLVAAIGQVTEIDMKPLWQPDEAFFEILRDKRVINAMVADIAGESVADSVLTDTGKVQKNIITNRIAGHGVPAPDLDWRPRWMGFPASGYLEDGDASPAIASIAVENMLVEQQSKDEETPLKDAA